MALATTRPMPIPGPIAAPPYTMPRPMVWRPALLSTAAAARTWSKGSSLVFRMHRSADVDGGENGEDEGLQERDEDLEPGEGEEQRVAERQDDHENARLEDRGADHREGREDQVAREHVGEQPHHQRERLHEEV